MNQEVNFDNQQVNADFAINNMANASMLPSTSEHRSVLVSRKFINGLVTSYNKSKTVAVDVYQAPAFETPSFEVPKFDFEPVKPIAAVETPAMPTIEPVAPVAPVEPTVSFEPVKPVEEPVSQPNFDIPKFDFSSIASNVAMPVASSESADSSASDGGTAINIANYSGLENVSNEELLNKYSNIDGISTETMLFEVQSTLNSLANMVSILTQQRTDLLAQQDEIADANEMLDRRQETLELKERTVEEAEQANEIQRQEIEKLAADNARQLSERTLALKAKAQELEDKERAYMNRVEELNKDIAKNVEDAKNLKRRAEELNIKEAELDKLSIELKGRLNNLVDAENKFKVIVKEFNDTVNFNNTLNSIASPIKQLKKEINNEEKAA